MWVAGGTMPPVTGRAAVDGKILGISPIGDEPLAVVVELHNMKTPSSHLGL